MGALLENSLAIYLDAAPWLLFGLLAAGAIRVWLPEERLSRWLGGGGLWPVTKAALIGAPLPLCSCGVLPAALGLRRGGASKGATISFLIATPETGADSIAVSYALLGPFMALLRPIAAILSAIFSGLLVALLPQERPRTPTLTLAVAGESACSGGCCCSAEGTEKPQATLWQGVRHAVVDILDDIAPWLAIGILLAGVVATLLPPQTLAEWGSGPLAMGVMLLIGVPMYICATASTPLAAALLLAGISPGTVLVFLLAGPATNIATLAVVRRELGGGVLVAYLGGIAVASVALGLLTDMAVAALRIDVAVELSAGGEVIPYPLQVATAIFLALLALRPLRRRIPGLG